ncbi:COX15/CtaA family protein [Amorphus orientalis]|uniref:Heme A synthase n=1 Tax=Amorphus orientalis TaxID=649198 RepID=A0AAE4ASA2_9HYPH|nr:COX15/CtaA family protein [Amorphus orientalis]MDQ0316031.1 cytochrome c oxidase assembly protein subunit 15 [Amorphus orientalis]
MPNTPSAAHTESALPAIRTWLLCVAALIVAMIVVGGATRLTDSGLSITEWKPIHGVIPPLSAAEWHEEFEKYRQIPEYQLINKGMSLSEFKAIFWWEWAHRFLGRFIGIAFFLPMVVFWARGQVPGWLKPRLVGLFLLGGLQGAVGWWMVASGLVDRVDVSQYRLATHLTLACLILAAIVWTAEGLKLHRHGVRTPAPDRTRWMAWGFLALIVVQIFLGGLLAGLDAGMVYNTWPLMDGRLIPSGLFFESPWWINAFENRLTVQFDHRMMGYAIVVFAAVQWLVAARTAGRSAVSSRAGLLFGFVIVQAVIGIATVVLVVPLMLALAHQLTAALLLWAAVVHARRTVAENRQPALSAEIEKGAVSA